MSRTQGYARCLHGNEPGCAEGKRNPSARLRLSVARAESDPPALPMDRRPELGQLRGRRVVLDRLYLIHPARAPIHDHLIQSPLGMPLAEDDQAKMADWIADGDMTPPGTREFSQNILVGETGWAKRGVRAETGRHVGGARQRQGEPIYGSGCQGWALDAKK